jgi:hypothetical protein
MRSSILLTICFGLAGTSACGAEPVQDGADKGAATSEALQRHRPATSQQLDSKRRPVFWDGSVSAGETPLAGAPPECETVPCDHVRLDIDLPRATFRGQDAAGDVQVALRWFGNPGPHQLPPDVPGCCGEFDTLHLFVYKDGALRAQSAGIIAVSQSAFLEAPENGTYDVWIAYDPTYNVGPTVEYEALAEVELAPRRYPERELLPDLEFRGTERITFETPSFPIFEPDPPPGSSCFQSETDEDGAQNCLRFDQIIANVGVSPLELRFSVPNDQPVENESELDVSQRIFSSDGSYVDEPAGSMELHGVHGHYHYSSFATSELWASNARGQRLGAAPLRGAQKVSFCIADIRIDAWGQKGDGPRTYFAPDCLFPASTEGNLDHFVQGLTNGWADTYDWYIPDQYIEVTGVTDGFYLLRFCADPNDSIQESNERNNCLTNHLRLSGMGTTSQAVDVLGIVGK